MYTEIKIRSLSTELYSRSGSETSIARIKIFFSFLTEKLKKSIGNHCHGFVAADVIEGAEIEVKTWECISLVWMLALPGIYFN